ncbi:MAG: haloacid dehalogenase type II [Xanthomonadales bacterium]|nr:haloacid dehalogenase type II [Xanthomonadales bacterium]
MSTTLALDVYGTLIDPFAIKTSLIDHVGDKADVFAETWRTKQLEYSFRRGLMGVYRDFSHVTRAALDYACEMHGARIADDDKNELMNHYRALDAFPDVATALSALQQRGVALHAFSNGVADDITALLNHAGLGDRISSIVSADEVHTFKPDPRFYAHFLERTQSTADLTWLVSSNPFDVIGAQACGWRTVWVKRNPKVVFDPWGHVPTAIISDLMELPALFTSDKGAA